MPARSAAPPPAKRGLELPPRSTPPSPRPQLYPKKLINRVSTERKKAFLDTSKEPLAKTKEESDKLEAKGDKTKEGIKAR